MTRSAGNGDTVCLCLVLHEPEALKVSEWVKEKITEDLMPPVTRVDVRDVGTAGTCDVDNMTGVKKDNSGDAVSGRFCCAAIEALGTNSTAPGSTSVTSSVFVLIVAIFWDGQSESSKNEFIGLKKFTDEKVQGSGPQAGMAVRIAVQALNAKMSNNKLMETRDAVVCSLRKKLQGLIGLPCHVDPCTSVADAKTQSVSAPSSTAPAPVKANACSGSEVSNKKGCLSVSEDLSAPAVAARIEEGQGECFIAVAGHTMEEFERRVEQLRTAANSIGVGCAPVLEEPREVQSSSVDSFGEKTKLFVQEFLIRQSASVEDHIEMRIAMCGNVDSGKSTLTSVLTRGCRDNGRGLARAFVFRHKHEAATGRTSSVSENHIGFSSTGEVVNYTVISTKHSGASVGCRSNEDNGGGSKPVASISPQQLAQEIVAKSAKVLTLYDLAGHERYLKTTVLGMTRNVPDYACVVISANNGIQRMTKEHIALCLALKIPFFVVVTRIDSTPENVQQETLASIHKLLKVPTVRKLPYPVQRVDDVVLSAKNLRNDRITPIFQVSNVSGVGLPQLTQFLNLLPMRKDWRAAREQPREMVIDNTFFVTGVGTVVGGIVTQGVFHANDTVLLGPDMNGAFRSVQIKSIHVKGVEQARAVAGCDAAFCLKKEKRKAIRKGNVLTDPLHPVKANWQFEADIVILYHSTTILVNYEPVIHSTTVRQPARIVYVAKEVLRTGDRSIVRFHFLYRPEFMKVGQQLIFREGRTKGIGTVTRLIAEREESLLMKKRVK
ncbi:Elongation factor Tu GTP binding domain [Trypanosoma vivax]|nr:Elongation factor Tu GTP binding domain [Trypanosoma vivax]